MKMNKKGQGIFDNIGSLGIGIASLAIILVVVFLIISAAQTNIESTDTHGNWSSAYNATNTLAGAVDTIPSWIPIVVITAIGGILIGLVSIFRR